MIQAFNNSGNETVAIIGGGVIGLACAHYLNEAGYQVAVIEKMTWPKPVPTAIAGLSAPAISSRWLLQEQ